MGMLKIPSAWAAADKPAVFSGFAVAARTDSVGFLPRSHILRIRSTRENGCGLALDPSEKLRACFFEYYLSRMCGVSSDASMGSKPELLAQLQFLWS